MIRWRWIFIWWEQHYLHPKMRRLEWFNNADFIGVRGNVFGKIFILAGFDKFSNLAS